MTPLDMDPSEAETAVAKKPNVGQPAPRSRGNSVVLLVASVISLAVIVLSIYVLTRTMGADERPVMTVFEQVEVVKEAPAPAADVMLDLDVTPKDADVRVSRSSDGYRVRVSAPGFRTEERLVAKGVVERIEIELKPKPEKRRVKRKRKKKKRKKGDVDGDVFLTGGDL